MSDFRAGDKADPANASKPAALKAHGLAEALSLTARVLGQVLSGASLDSAMRDIVQKEEAATVPVVAWVAPVGGRAASAIVCAISASFFLSFANSSR